MYLTETRDPSQHEEVELLLEGYKLDLEEIQVSIRTMLAQVMKETEHRFINVLFEADETQQMRLSAILSRLKRTIQA